MLKFLGRGSAFADEQNSAFFISDDELVLIDCPMSAFHKLKRLDLSKMTEESISKITVLVTHTHSDHCGGIPMLIHFAFFMFHIPVVVVAPSEEIKADIFFLIDRLDGCSPEGYELITASDLDRSWFKAAIPTEHAPALKGRCFGYILRIEGKDIVYTGDTNTLAPFMDHLKPGCELYSEISVYKSPVHLYFVDIFPVLKELSETGIRVYLMHLDNEELIKKNIVGSAISLAPLYENYEGSF